MLPSQHSMLGRHRHASETPFKWRFAGMLMMAAFGGFMILSPLINQKKLKKKSNFLDPRMFTMVVLIANNLKTALRSYCTLRSSLIRFHVRDFSSLCLRGWSVVCDCGISWSYSLTFSYCFVPWWKFSMECISS